MLTLRFGTVEIAQPGSATGRLSLSAILVREEEPPSETDVIEWLLLTTDPLATAAGAWTRVDWYRRRWLIEEFHKGLKTTFRVESRQFKARQPFEVSGDQHARERSHSLHAWRRPRRTRRTSSRTAHRRGGTRASHDFRSREHQEATARLHRITRASPRRDARGVWGRKGDGEPGFQTIALGLEKLALVCAGFRLAAASFTLDTELLPEPSPAIRAFFIGRTVRIPH